MGGDAQPLEAGHGHLRGLPPELALHEPVGDVHDADRESAMGQARGDLDAEHPAPWSTTGPPAALGGRDDPRGVGHVLEHEHPVDQALVVGDAP